MPIAKKETLVNAAGYLWREREREREGESERESERENQTVSETTNT
jgi:hypothetical protein